MSGRRGHHSQEGRKQRSGDHLELGRIGYVGQLVEVEPGKETDRIRECHSFSTSATDYLSPRTILSEPALQPYQFWA